MAAKLLLPGEGGMYTSETFTSASSTSPGADTIDCSRCGQLKVGVEASVATAGTFTLQQRIGVSTSWSNFATTFSGTAVGNVLYDITDGPFGVMRIKPATALDAGSATITIIGYPIQESF